MARYRSSRRRRSNSRTVTNRGAESRSLGWRAILLAAPLVYGIGVLAGDLVAVVVLDASFAVLGSGVGVGMACVLVSLGLSRLIDRLRRTEPRSIGSIASPRTSLRVGTSLLLIAFCFGFALAVLG